MVPCLENMEDAEARYIPGLSLNYRLVNKYMRKLLVLHFSQRIVLLNCFLVVQPPLP
jgi:hypothetical protein